MTKKNEPTLFDDDEHSTQELPTEAAGTSASDAKKISKISRNLYELSVPDTIFAIKQSAACNSLAELRDRLSKDLPQNSAETRVQSARFIIRRFFSDGLNGIARKTWVAYQDGRITLDILRYLYLSNETIAGACVADCLFPIEIGMRIPISLFDRFLASCYAETPLKKTGQRLKANLVKLGFLEASAEHDHFLMPIAAEKTSLLILTHHLFAPNGPRTIELKRLFANPFWKYLGYKSEDDVRTVFREADAAGFLGKYVVADQLEQITTRWGLDEFLSNQPRL